MTSKLKIGFFIGLGLIAASCNNLDNVKPAERSTFTHFFGGIGNFEGIAAEEVSDGYVIVGDSMSTSAFGTIIIKTDKFGNQVWRIMINGGTADAMAVASDGYLIIGDSIKVNLSAAQVIDTYVRKSRLIKVDPTGKVLNDVSFGDTTTNSLQRVDHSGNAITVNGNNIFAVNAVRLRNGNSSAMVTSLTLTSFASADTAWSETYSILNRDFVNSKSVHLTAQGQVIWASTPTLSSQTATRAYIGLPVVKQSSTFDNNSLFGQNDDLYYSANDIQPSILGFGVIGTFQAVTGGNKNLYFVRADKSGNIQNGSERFFDGSSPNILLTDKTVSTSDDVGSALIATSDGGYLLAGSTSTTAVRGNGGSDIWLIRVDAAGNVMWNKIIGGSGSETVSTVRLTADGGFLICGTLNLAGLESIFVIKTDKNGELNN